MLGFAELTIFICRTARAWKGLQIIFTFVEYSEISVDFKFLLGRSGHCGLHWNTEEV